MVPLVSRSSAPWTSPRGITDLLSALGMLLSVVGLVATLLAGAAGGAGSDPAAGPGGEPSGPEAGYEVPDLDTQAELELIRHDVNLAIKLLRHEEGAPPVVMDPFNLQLQAQQWAEHTAVAGRQENSPRNVTMIQHNLPESEASGHAFVDAWLHSEAHTAVLLDERYTFYGIGVAVGHGRVWVAVQYSA
ncbi:CAP domain-containing protein [Corynebacterium marinum]|uniref:SCP domain-containing protein n=1 Tax=Corynebacterium marinum DSM 44953 TaxID=1224162 RepID=A0A0B6TNY7_9CORY|nr:CAP domain-containing protein [Corynebacterium marinum]AJK69638.1 hypothetical protein B840_10275 [Corynebacterium marinum DSM 44953]GGO22796.1 hypothetical protein GCM10010980_25230 [Corynebacterium marinum]